MAKPEGRGAWLRRRASVGLMCIATASGLSAADAGLLGATRADAEAQLGRPTSVLKRGASEVLVFNDGVLVYAFHDIRHLEGKHTARGVLDA